MSARRSSALVIITVLAGALLAGCSVGSSSRALPVCPDDYTAGLVERGVWTVADPQIALDKVDIDIPTPSCVVTSATSEPGGTGLTEGVTMATYLDLNPGELDSALTGIAAYARKADMTRGVPQLSDGVTTLIFDGSEKGTVPGVQLIVSYVSTLQPTEAATLGLTDQTSYLSVSALDYSAP